MLLEPLIRAILKFFSYWRRPVLSADYGGFLPTFGLFLLEPGLPVLDLFGAADYIITGLFT